MKLTFPALLFTALVTLGGGALLAFQDDGDGDADPAPIIIQCESVVPQIFLAGGYYVGPFPSEGAAWVAAFDGTAMQSAILQAVQRQYGCSDCPDGAPPCPASVRLTSFFDGSATVVKLFWWWFVDVTINDPSMAELECGSC